ncbi:3-amino-4-hydroxybenzoic acid synthase [Lentzea albidocapillata subsp. violacea]|uniref:3-amino-4-hydroxybenzoic acid synthase n=1 Tax=Lentzea albidocapillata subsp. violacea TaxID=128104 RepID=A0A1G9I411_9PSEU|nr:3-dehydroquinate synthase II [Lentzea albidocapillata]SDL19959.1 3-amino-4-hydroxybenzoic acid synthase [Lentzea albidocapillata subsp. violacea]
MKFAWIDLRTVPEAHWTAVIDAAVHSRIGVVTDDPSLLDDLPPTVTRVLLVDGPVDSPHLVTVAVHDQDQLDRLSSGSAFVTVRDDRTLKLACAAAERLDHTVVAFTDPTKIPLEIVIAAADGAPGKLVTVVADLVEAAIVLEVLEHGSDGVLMAPRDATDVFKLARLLEVTSPPLTLTTLTVEALAHNGLGDRVCVDTASHFREDEGILVGSFSSGFILCCSETHPLPYMPTRPFRVNAGALHSYVLGPANRTNYLSELRSGSKVLAVDADGRTRELTVGRAKLESRPMLTITARSPENVVVDLMVQDDWHVRVLAPGGKVRNVTELQPGDELLGYIASEQRHVGLPIGEFCKES